MRVCFSKVPSESSLSSLGSSSVVEPGNVLLLLFPVAMWLCFLLLFGKINENATEVFATQGTVLEETKGRSTNHVYSVYQIYGGFWSTMEDMVLVLRWTVGSKVPRGVIFQGRISHVASVLRLTCARSARRHR